MLFEESFSGVGKATGTHLDALRIQMGHGVDPAFDYSKERNLPKWEPPAWTAEESVQMSNADAVRAGILQLSGDAPEAAPPEPFRMPDTLHAPGPLEVRKQREAQRPSSAFLKRSRSDLGKLDIANRFRAPPVGTYKPSDEVGRPRTPGTVPFSRHAFRGGAGQDCSQQDSSASGVDAGRDIEQLQGSKDISVEVGDIVEKKPPHLHVVDFSKVPPRPDFFASSGVQCNENTFTDGVMDGHLKCSQATRQPCHEFSKTPAQAQGPQGYAEPGLYNVKDRLVRPRSGQQNFRFEKQPGRRPMSAPVHAGHCRPSASKSCPRLSSERRVCGVPDLAKCTSRPPLVNPSARVESGETEARDRRTDLNEADKNKAGRQSRPKSAGGAFCQDLNRKQHHRAMRGYADDVCLQLMKENEARGPVSVELLDDIDKRPCFERPVQTFKFSQIPGRERANSKKASEPPARRRITGKSPAKFARCARAGDSKCNVQGMSRLACDIAELRATRTYVEMPVN